MKTDDRANLRKLLLEHLDQSNEWCKKGEMYMIGEREEYSPEYVGRLLRFMAGGATKKYPNHLPEIMSDTYKGKRGQKLVRYASIDTPPPLKITREPRIVELPTGERIALYA